jgi:sodium transport system permease protein
MTRPTSQPRTASLYHAASGSAFSAFEATAITFGAVATFLVVAALVHARLSVEFLAVAQLGLVVVPVVVMRLTRRDRRALGLTRPRLRHIVGAGLVGTCAWYVNLHLLALLPQDAETPPAMEKAVQQPSLALVLLTIAFVPAICEEILFRGVLVRGLGTQLHAWVAILVGALAFSAYHLNPIQLLPTFTLGLAFGVIAMRAHSAIPTMLGHALNNGIAILVAREDLPGLANQQETGFLDRHPILMLSVAALVVLSGLAIVVFDPVERPRGLA